MAEVDAVVPNTSDAMEGIEASAEPPSVPPEDEYSCETLYIQNLNEKIKPEGFAIVYQVIMILKFTSAFFFFFSSQGIVAWPLQIIRWSVGRCCTQQLAYARSGVCFVSIGRDCKESYEGCATVPFVFETYGSWGFVRFIFTGPAECWTFSFFSSKYHLHGHALTL